MKSWKNIIIALVSGLICGCALTFIFVAWMLNHSPLMNPELRKVQEVYENINQNYYKPVTSKKLINGAIKGMIDSLDDPYSELLTGSRQAEFSKDLSGKISGIGATITKDIQGVRIVAIMPHSPAALAHLKKQDIILKINKHVTKNLTVAQASSLTRGKTNTKIQLQIQRGSQKLMVNLRRRPLQIATVTGELLANKKTIGKITITQFSENTAQELKKEVQALKRQGARSLIIDVRNNPGGVMDQAVASASMFLKNQQRIVTLSARQQKDITYRSSAQYLNNYKVKLPVVVLIDTQSASAAEIFAAALNESGQIPLVGERSFGKGVVQTLNSVTTADKMKLTTAKWLTPSGHWLNHHGLKPTYRVTYPDYLELPSFSSQQTLTSGSTANDVLTAQKILQVLGFSLEVTGHLDEATAQSLSSLQQQQQLPVTGQLDLLTRQVLTQNLLVHFQNNDTMVQQAVTLLTKQKGDK
ncbi:S41 family peptidase [Bombilactobacillus bombi]|uniref:S41 family peptidase n=1 Tax=Bombilactobacillus bombi TaxID=1303590 RepID=UPI0015E62671|nr:S41 family peptidase [Bombilactobacillus bombi]MBA1435173.1 S41 family peptidase [Bombilactobacillus bombi]